MKREQEQALIKQSLDEELGQLQFARKAEVLRRTHPRSWPERLRAWWNRELEIPLLPLGVGAALLLAFVLMGRLADGDNGSAVTKQQRHLIEAGGNIYWNDEYDKAVASVEGDPKS